ncbi:hypothetical protein GCM10007989_35040 [Devosia pacifica]|uniref:Uncharacterized protein n=1 Tax=Devosia pacifica TaxID=1335967 RepID=A0A918SF64_9HYPH|nr:hypothetical protein GCM10007989_35040 [Devosia pacifica]
MGRDIGAAGSAIGIAPTVILALEFGAFIDADGQADAAMQAAIFPDIDVAIIGAPDGELTPQQLAMEDMAIWQILTRSDWMPGGGQFRHRRL